MGFQPWVPQEDTNTEIRVAMLLSLILQIALIFLGPMRKSSSFPRSIIWSCYLLADWVADLALGLLLNNMGNIGGSNGNSVSSLGMNRLGAGGKNNGTSSSNSGSPIIFAFWTPFLLLHLGGPDTITAYAVEDNELWLRHLIGLLFELFSAAVIFFCSLRGNPMIGATVLIFVAGIIKYGERTYSLYSGSIKSYRANILGPGNPGPNYARLMEVFQSKKDAGLVVELSLASGELASKAQEIEEELDIAHLESHGIEVQAYELFLIFRRLFVDLILNSRQRRLSQALFLDLMHMPNIAFEIIESELDFIYDMVYTKAPIAYTWAGWVLRFICSGCIASACVIFFLHDKRGMKRVDVGITYALLLGGLALDMAALTMLLFSSRASVFFHKSRRFNWLEWLTSRVPTQRRHWARSVSQFNLINYASGKPYHYKGRLFLRVAKMLHVEEVLEDLIYVQHQTLSAPRHFYSQTTADILMMALFKDAAKKLGEDNKQNDQTVKLFNYHGDRTIQHYKQEIMDALLLRERREISRALSHEEERKIMVMDACLPLGEKTKIMHALDALHALPLEEKTQIMDALVTEEKREIMHDLFWGKVDKMEIIMGSLLSGEKTEITDAGLSREKIEMIEIIMEGLRQLLGEKRKIIDAQLKQIMDRQAIMDFDESLLLWHIATDLCLLQVIQGPPTQSIAYNRPMIKIMSEYMMYLLIKQPEMLSAKTGIWLMRYQDTCAEARQFSRYMAKWIDESIDVRKLVLDVNTSQPPALVKGTESSKSVLFWWGCGWRQHWRPRTSSFAPFAYAARKCPGSTHVRQLNRGGELITLVWFLIEHMGLGEKYDVTDGGAMHHE